MEDNPNKFILLRLIAIRIRIIDRHKNWNVPLFKEAMKIKELNQR